MSPLSTKSLDRFSDILANGPTKSLLMSSRGVSRLTALAMPANGSTYKKERRKNMTRYQYCYWWNLAESSGRGWRREGLEQSVVLYGICICIHTGRVSKWCWRLQSGTSLPTGSPLYFNCSAREELERVKKRRGGEGEGGGEAEPSGDVMELRQSTVQYTNERPTSTAWGKAWVFLFYILSWGGDKPREKFPSPGASHTLGSRPHRRRTSWAGPLQRTRCWAWSFPVRNNAAVVSERIGLVTKAIPETRARFFEAQSH